MQPWNHLPSACFSADKTAALIANGLFIDAFYFIGFLESTFK